MFEGKGIPMAGHESPRGMWTQGLTCRPTKPQVRWLAVRSAVFNSGESHRYTFYRTLSVPQDQSGDEGVKKNLHPSDTRDRNRVVQPELKRLAA